MSAPPTRRKRLAAFRERRRRDTKRWRERLANGRACYTIEVDGSTFDLLEQLGWLPRRTDDRRAVAIAIGRLWRRGMDALLTELTARR
jgi:hypothetical protein